MQRNPVTLFLSLFLGSAAIVIVATGIGWMLGHADQASDTAKTKLEERIETARQIRRALATPIPPPEPLQPIAAKTARSQNTTPAEGDELNKPNLSRGARDSWARGERRSSRSSRDHGTGGW